VTAHDGLALALDFVPRHGSSPPAFEYGAAAKICAVSVMPTPGISSHESQKASDAASSQAPADLGGTLRLPRHEAHRLLAGDGGGERCEQEDGRESDQRLPHVPLLARRTALRGPATGGEDRAPRLWRASPSRGARTCGRSPSVPLVSARG